MRLSPRETNKGQRNGKLCGLGTACTVKLGDKALGQQRFVRHGRQLCKNGAHTKGTKGKRRLCSIDSADVSFDFDFGSVHRQTLFVALTDVFLRR